MMEDTWFKFPWALGEFIEDKDPIQGNDGCIGQEINLPGHTSAIMVWSDATSSEEILASKARLVLAAPVMLKALIMVRDQMLRAGVTYDNAEEYNEVQQAINKATKEDPYVE